MKNNAGPKLAPKLVVAAAVLLLAGLTAWLIGRRLPGVSIVKATTFEERKILGDLMDAPPTDRSGAADWQGVRRLADDPVVARVVDTFGRPPAVQRKDVLDSRRITEQFEKLIAGKRLVWSADQGWPAASLRSLAKLYVAQIAEAAQDKDTTRCFDLSRRAIKFDNALRSPAGATVIDVLVGYAIDSIIFRGLQQAARNDGLSAAQLIDLYAQIPPAPRTDRRVADALHSELARTVAPALMKLQDGEQQLRGSVEAPYVLSDSKPDDRDVVIAGQLDMPATLRMLAAVEAEEIANCGRPWNRQMSTASSEFRAKVKALPDAPLVLNPTDSWFKRTAERWKYASKMASIPNSVGLMALRDLTDLTVAAFSFRMRTRLEFMRLTLLIEAYESLHAGVLPPDLNALEKLSGKVASPTDFYAGGPFHYDAKRRIVWSVGENGFDDGGIGTAADGPDLVFALP